jgi:hypothetical protein
MLTPRAADKLQALSSLEVTGPGDVAVKEYGELQVPTFDNVTSKLYFGKGMM